MPKDKASILIVDDTRENLITLNAILEDLDQNLVFANSAREALRYALTQDFAVILLDVHMPIMDGFETARLIRSREKSSYTPIIFLSALNKSETDVTQGYAMGAVDYIFKPINPTILRSKVKVFVDLFTKSALAINLQNELQHRKMAEAERLRAEQRTRKQQRQLQLAEQDRLRALEEMTSALAHELNQPLATIANYVNGCTHRLKSGEYQMEDLLSALQHAGKQAERAGAILHRIKNSVRKSKLYYEEVDLNQLIVAATTLVQDSIQEVGIDLKLDLSKKLSFKIKIDKIQIEQVIINLLRNGVEALRNHPHPQRTLRLQTKLNADKTITINVKDNGPGILPAHADHIFDLYFTTKEEGTGIGLSICRTIIEAHGGNIHAKHNRSGGAWFQMTLPASVIAHEQ